MWLEPGQGFAEEAGSWAARGLPAPWIRTGPEMPLKCASCRRRPTCVPPGERLGMFLMIPITLTFHGVANTNDHIG